MKRRVIAVCLLSACFVLLTFGSYSSTFSQDATPISTGGMPSRPAPARPIPHHEPGQPSKAASYASQVSQVDAQGVEQTVRLTGLDALLQDGVIDDPLAGNYRLVGLDKVMFGSYAYGNPNNFSVQSFEFVTPTLVLTDTVSYGNVRFNAIAAGDLNGDFVDEQIATWVYSANNHIYMNIGEMPGSPGRITSVPAAVARPTGPDSFALQFNGVNYFVTIPAVNLSDYNAMAIEAWVKPADITTNRFYEIIRQSSFSSPDWLVAFQEYGTILSFGLRADYYYQELDVPIAPAAFTDGRWHRILATYDGANQRLSVDGRQIGSQSRSGNIRFDSSAGHWIGSWNGIYDVFNGRIDQVSIWNRVPDDTDLGLVARWSFEEGTGTTTADVTGHGYTGTLTSAAMWVADHAPSGPIHLLARGYDEALWRGICDADGGACHVSNAAGGLLASGPAVASRGGDAFDVFALGVDNLVYHRQWDGHRWSDDWQVEPDDPALPLFAAAAPTRTVPMPELTAPAAVVSGTNQIDLFRRGPDNTLWWRHSNDGSAWDSWQNLGGMLASGPGAVSLGDGRMQVYVLGMDRALWYRTYDDSWGDWQRLETPDGVAGDAFPVLTSPVTGQVTVYLAGTENRIWSIHYDGSSWGIWNDYDVTGGNLGLGIGAAAGSSGTHLVAHMADGRLRYSQDGATWTDLDWLNVSQTLDTGSRTITLPVDSEVENPIFDLTTGYFSGDGRQQVVLAYDAYDGADGQIRLEVYDIYDGFRLTKTAELTSTISSANWPRVAAGDVNGDGVDEIGLATILDSPGTHVKLTLRVFQIEKDANGQWTGNLTEIQKIEKNITHWNGAVCRFGGTLRIAAGDIIEEVAYQSADEFALVSDCRYDGTGHDIDNYLHVYDFTSSNFIEKSWSTYIGGYSWDNDYATGVGLAVGDVDGVRDAQNRVFDEVVLTQPSGWSGSYPELKRDLVVYGWQGSALVEKAKYSIPSFSRWSYLDTLAIGDLDQDLKAEIVMANHTRGYSENSGYGLDVYEFESLSSGPVYRYTLPYSTPPTAFNLALGDFTGESLRVGPPSYRLQRSTGDIIALLNEPPKHVDTLGGVTYDINSTDTGTYAAYENEQSQSTEMSIQVQRDWSFAAGMEMGIGDPEGTHVKTSLDATYGEHFENATTAFSQVDFGSEVKATSDDIVYYTGKDLQVWEYPVYESTSQTPTGRIMVVFPLPGVSNTGTREFYETGNSSCDFWYAPEHQINNVWSYPRFDTQLPDYDPQKGILNTLQTVTVGPTEGEFWTHWQTITTTRQASSLNLGVDSMFESQIGGDSFEVSAEPFGVGVSYEVHVPYVKGTLQNSYSTGALSTHTVVGSNDTTIRVHLNPVDTTGIYNYEVTPYLYWAKDGYLVLDYLTNPKSTTFWNLYNQPDPAFVLPWADGHCAGKEQFSKDIVISPPFASNGEAVTITATVHNFSNYAASNVRVRFYRGEPSQNVPIGQDQFINLSARGKVDVPVAWQASGTGEQRIYAVIDPNHEIVEMHDEITNTQNNNNVAFGLIAMGDSGFVDPGAQTYFDYQSLTYTDTQGLATRVFIPTAAMTETARLEMVPLSPTVRIRHGFSLAAYKGGSDRHSSWDLTFDPVPAAIWVSYSEADIDGLDEDELILYRYNSAQGKWVDAACGAYQRHPEENWMLVPVCRTGDFALLSPHTEIFLPLVRK